MGNGIPIAEIQAADYARLTHHPLSVVIHTRAAALRSDVDLTAPWAWRRKPLGRRSQIKLPLARVGCQRVRWVLCPCAVGSAGFRFQLHGRLHDKTGLQDKSVRLCQHS
jgi:hypothetical protein